MTLVVEVKLNNVEKLSKSQLNGIHKRANFAVGVHFRRHFLAARFTEKGGRRLGYTPRSGEHRIGMPSLSRKDRHKYAPRKEAKVGHSRPLELSGEGRRQALSQPRKVRSTRDKIIIPLPRKYNFRPKGGRISMSDEIRKVTNREAAKLSKRLVDDTERENGRIAGPSRRRRVRSATISNL